MRRRVHPGIMSLFMTTIQEEALYNFLDDADKTFKLGELVSYVQKLDSEKINRLTKEAEAFINERNLAFRTGKKQWASRRSFFEPLSFVITPTRLELANGILIPGHRCIPFANPNLLPQEYCFHWRDSPIPLTTTEGPPEDFYPFYSVFGEEYAPQYVARDNEANEEAFNSDPYDDPPEVSITTFDLRNVYMELAFVPGDRFLVKTLDWKDGIFSIEKVGKDEWKQADLDLWLSAAEDGFEESFRKLGTASSTEEQIAYAYWYGSARMREIPAYSLEDFLYNKTSKIETTAYGIETRFWYAGREIPDLKCLDLGNARSDRTPVEEALYKLKIPISEFGVQSYIRDSLYRDNGDKALIMARLVPSSADADNRDMEVLSEYVETVVEEFRNGFSPFSDKAVGPLRQRACELHTAVIDLAARLGYSDIDLSWLPRHTFIILSQIQNHAAGLMEDMDIDEPPLEAELEAIESSLDSMIETYEEIKELIDESMNSFRRNSFSVIRPGSNATATTEWLIQLSIGSIDIWRRLIVGESCSLRELHGIIQTVFLWRDSQTFQFTAETGQKETASPKIIDPDNQIKTLESSHITELLYEYGNNWTVRIMLLSKNSSPGSRPVRCVAGARAAPPEFIDGPSRFKKIIYALENGNDMERLGAQKELGPEFLPEEFDLDICNRNLIKCFPVKE